MMGFSGARAVTMTMALLIGGAAFAPVQGQGSSSSQDALAELAWLAGCWRLEAGPRVTDEQWMAPSGGLMMGMSRTVIGGRVRETERLIIRETDGAVDYVADPSGQRETVFTTTRGDSVWVFANAAHDFPQRIIYRRAAADSLWARIEGEADGQTRAVDFPMVRVACGG